MTAGRPPDEERRPPAGERRPNPNQTDEARRKPPSTPPSSHAEPTSGDVLRPWLRSPLFKRAPSEPAPTIDKPHRHVDDGRGWCRLCQERLDWIAELAAGDKPVPKHLRAPRPGEADRPPTVGEEVAQLRADVRQVLSLLVHTPNGDHPPNADDDGWWPPPDDDRSRR